MHMLNKQFIYHSIRAGLIGLLLTSCSRPQAQPAATTPKEDFLKQYIETSVSPGDDFFTYANGGWLKRNPIPASESAWGIANVVRDELYDQLQKINETSAQKKAATGTDEQKIGDFWTTAMDEAKKIEKAGELTEDQLRDLEGDVQKLTDRFVKSIDDHIERKEAEVMKV
jgi:putative endopeptidase